MFFHFTILGQFSVKRQLACILKTVPPHISSLCLTNTFRLHWLHQITIILSDAMYFHRLQKNVLIFTENSLLLLRSQQRLCVLPLKTAKNIGKRWSSKKIFIVPAPWCCQKVPWSISFDRAVGCGASWWRVNASDRPRHSAEELYNEGYSQLDPVHLP